MLAHSNRTSLPNPKHGDLIVGHTALLIGDEKRAVGKAVPEAWGWQARILQAHLNTGSLVFRPKAAGDPEFVSKLLDMMPPTVLKRVASAYDIPDGKRGDLIHTLLVMHGFAEPEPAPEPALVEEAPPAPEPVPQLSEYEVERLKLMAFPEHELRSSVAHLYGFVGDKKFTKGQGKAEMVSIILAKLGIVEPSEEPDTDPGRPPPLKAAVDVEPEVLDAIESTPSA